MNRMQSKKIRYLLFSGLILVIFGMTVAFAVLSGQLILEGKVNRKGGTWEMEFNEDTITASLKGGAQNGSITVDGDEITVSASLTQSGDEIVYFFTIENSGTVDAKLSSYSFKEDSGSNSLSAYNVEYYLTYEDGTNLTIGDVLSPGESQTFQLKLVYNGANPVTEDTYFSYTAQIVYAQA